MTNQNSKLDQLLTDIGLDQDEAKIYMAVLDNGPLLPLHLAQKTGINRATLYTKFPGLIKSGIIHEVRQGKRRLMAPVSPDTLFEGYEEKYKELKQNLGELASLYRMQGMKPEIQVFEGTEDIKKLYTDTLSAKGEVVIYNSIMRYRDDVLDWIVKEFVPRRIKLKIKVRAIVCADEAGRLHMAPGKEFFRETRFVPLVRFPFRIEVMIYNDKISFFTCEKGGPQVGIIIKNKAIAETQKSLFNLAWEGAGKYGK